MSVAVIHLNVNTYSEYNVYCVWGQCQPHVVSEINRHYQYLTHSQFMLIHRTKKRPTPPSTSKKWRTSSQSSSYGRACAYEWWRWAGLGINGPSQAPPAALTGYRPTLEWIRLHHDRTGPPPPARVYQGQQGRPRCAHVSAHDYPALYNKLDCKPLVGNKLDTTQAGHRTSVQRKRHHTPQCHLLLLLLHSSRHTCNWIFIRHSLFTYSISVNYVIIYNKHAYINVNGIAVKRLNCNEIADELR